MFRGVLLLHHHLTKSYLETHLAISNHLACLRCFLSRECLLLASASGSYMNNAILTIDRGRPMASGSNDGLQMEDWTYVWYQ